MFARISSSLTSLFACPGNNNKDIGVIPFERYIVLLSKHSGHWLPLSVVIMYVSTIQVQYVFTIFYTS